MVGGKGRGEVEVEAEGEVLEKYIHLVSLNLISFHVGLF